MESHRQNHTDAFAANIPGAKPAIEAILGDSSHERVPAVIRGTGPPTKQTLSARQITDRLDSVDDKSFRHI